MLKVMQFCSRVEGTTLIPESIETVRAEGAVLIPQFIRTGMIMPHGNAPWLKELCWFMKETG